jgi:uncharacterized protein YdhG (YjbR/CyaY superfamily)
MISEAPDVATYIQQAPADRQPALRQLRKLAREIFNGSDECIAYGMAAYKQGDDLHFAFASQKQYIALYAGKAAIDEHKAALKGAKFGKGCIRYTKPEQLDFAVIRKVLLSTAKSRGGC